MEIYRREIGELAQSDEDVLSYALFPNLAVPFLKKRLDPFADVPEQYIEIVF